MTLSPHAAITPTSIALSTLPPNHLSQLGPYQPITYHNQAPISLSPRPLPPYHPTILPPRLPYDPQAPISLSPNHPITLSPHPPTTISPSGPCHLDAPVVPLTRSPAYPMTPRPLSAYHPTTLPPYHHQAPIILMPLWSRSPAGPLAPFAGTAMCRTHASPTKRSLISCATEAGAQTGPKASTP